MDIIVEIFRCEEEISDIKAQYDYLRFAPYRPNRHQDLVDELHERFIKVRGRLHSLRKESGTRYAERINSDLTDLLELARKVDMDTRFLNEIGDDYKPGACIDEIEEAWVPKWKVA